MRVILVYGRSYGVPKLTTPLALSSLLEHSRFFIDVLYCHKKLIKDNQTTQKTMMCQEAFDFFINHFESDSGDKAEFLVEVGGSLPRFQQHLVMLLSNPLQRDDQDSFGEKLCALLS